MKENKEKLAVDAKLKQKLTDYFAAHNDDFFASVDPDMHEARCQVVESLLHAGIPLSKADAHDE